MSQFTQSLSRPIYREPILSMIHDSPTWFIYHYIMITTIIPIIVIIVVLKLLRTMPCPTLRDIDRIENIIPYWKSKIYCSKKSMQFDRAKDNFFKSIFIEHSLCHCLSVCHFIYWFFLCCCCVAIFSAKALHIV